MLPHLVSTPPLTASADAPSVRIGVGIDTSRYGHYAVFLRDDQQPAAAELPFAESAHGYAQLRHRLQQLVGRHGAVHFAVRVDVAGQYADNLLHFLHGLSTRRADPGAPGLANTTWAISCGDPQRNKDYRAALFGSQKSDPVEARAAARYALSERPASVQPMPTPLRALRQVAGRLQAVVRQRTRLINQCHHLLALAFPELALLVHDLAAGWVLELCSRYPTAPLLATASPADLGNIPYLPHQHIPALLEVARTSIGSLTEETMAELVRDQVRQLRDVRARQKRLENLLVSAYRQLPTANHLDTIPGIGPVTAAVLTAFILDIDRFDTPGKLVKYFGVLPIEASSGVDRDGRPRPIQRYIMSRRGNDLVRRYLWMAALSAVQCNPAVRSLYRRVIAKHPDHKAIAIGHAMRKLIHLGFAVWKTGKPFDPQHYPWEQPADQQSAVGRQQSAGGDQQRLVDRAVPEKDQAAGLRNPARPVRQEVTATRTDNLAATGCIGEQAFIDFAHLKKQLPLARVLDHLGLSSRLRGTGAQQRCTCPIHRGDARGRTFSVNLDDNVFQCFDATCGKKGDVLDLWAALHHQSLRQAALDLVQTFHLEPAPQKGTVKRNG